MSKNSGGDSEIPDHAREYMKSRGASDEDLEAFEASDDLDLKSLYAKLISNGCIDPPATS